MIDGSGLLCDFILFLLFLCFMFYLLRIQSHVSLLFVLLEKVKASERCW